MMERSGFKKCRISRKKLPRSCAPEDRWKDLHGDFSCRDDGRYMGIPSSGTVEVTRIK